MSSPYSGVAAMMLVLAAATTSVSGHGLIQSPPSRNWRCGADIKPHQAAGTECAQVFPTQELNNAGYQFMSVLTHTVGRKGVRPLPKHVCGFDAEPWFGKATPWDYARDWPTTPMSAGRNEFVWNIFWGSHFSDSEDFRYYITKPDFVFDPTKPMEWSDFEDEPFCDLPYNHDTPNANPDVVPDVGATLFTTYCNVPARSGHHVIYGEWGRNKHTYERFHGCIDVQMGGGSTGAAPRPAPQPRPVPVPQPQPQPAQPQPQPQPAQPAPAQPAPAGGSKCPADKSGCGCDWTKNGALCGVDDGSECFCKCCCEYTGKCSWASGGAPATPSTPAAGGSGSTCALPGGLDANAAPVDNTGFAQCHGKLHVGGASGLQLVNERNEPVQLMGMSSHGLHWFPNCYTKESLTHLVTKWGTNVFRAAMYVGEGGYGTDPSLKNKVMEIVQWAKELGVYVIVDWHMLNPGNPNDAEYSGAEEFWRSTARALKDEKHVLYEIANEPNGVQWSEVRAYHNRIISIIRSEDPDTIILAGTPTWSQEIDKAAAQPVEQPENVMYVFHFYAGTHMSLLSRVVEYSSKIPLFVTEWGTSEASGDGGPFLENALRFLDTFNNVGSKGVTLSWASWSYADKNEISATLSPGACGTKSWDSVSCSGSFIRSYIRSNVRTCSAGTPSLPAPQPRPVPVPQPQPQPQPRPVPQPQPQPRPVPQPQPQPQPTQGQCNCDCNAQPVPPVAVVPVPPAPAAPRPRPTPPTSSCTSTLPEYAGCLRSPGCCGAGTQCFEMNQWYAQCRKSCPSPSWSCKVLA